MRISKFFFPLSPVMVESNFHCGTTRTLLISICLMCNDFGFHLTLLHLGERGVEGNNKILISAFCGHITHLQSPWLPFPSLTRFPCILHILAFTWLDHPSSHGFPFFLISSFYSLICCSLHVSTLFLSLIAPTLFLRSVSFSSSSPVWTKGVALPSWKP